MLFMKPSKTLRFANLIMLLTLISFIVCASMAYGFDEHLPLMVTVLLHVAQIVLAGAFKFSYVLRLVSQKQLGQELH
ncbi:hypothetical protein QX776_06250 [Alteromonadaceae bacterium BrNp21-10]|nr:hypothetical protein [Alteromonadaceae bacterium BrNp21-10]